MKGKAQKRQRVVLTVNTQLDSSQDLKIFKAIPELDVIQEINVQYARRVPRTYYEKEGMLKPRKLLCND